MRFSQGLLRSCWLTFTSLFPGSDGEAKRQANGAVPISPSSNSTTHPTLPSDLYFTIAQDFAAFDFRTRQSTLLSLARVNREWSAVAVAELFKQPKHLDTVERQTQFAFALFLDPSVTRHITSLALRWEPESRNSKLIQLIVSRCDALRDLTLHRGKESEETVDPISQADIDALSSILVQVSRLQSLRLTYYGQAPKGIAHSLSAEDTSISLYADDFDGEPSEVRLVFPRSLTDQFRLLHTTALDGPTDWYWPVLSHCLGSTLRSLSLSRYTFSLSTGDLDRISAACPPLEHFAVGSPCLTHAEPPSSSNLSEATSSICHSHTSSTKRNSWTGKSR